MATKIRFRGHYCDWQTVDMIEQAEKHIGRPVHIIQGCYNKGGVSASAGTHDGAGAVDVWPTGGVSVNTVVWNFRLVGLAAWHRYYTPHLWTEHIHAVALDQPAASAGAKQQWYEYRIGQDGLADHRADNGPRPKPLRTWASYLKDNPKALNISYVNMLRCFTGKVKAPVLGVTRMQRCLNYHLGVGIAEDGVAGPTTRAAYKKWQAHLGWPKSKQHGRPTPAALKKLTAGHYHVVV